MRPLLLAAAAAATLAVTARAAEPVAVQAQPAAVQPAPKAAPPAQAAPAAGKPDLKPAPAKPEGKGTTAGSSKAEPPKAPDAKPCEPVKPCTID